MPASDDPECEFRDFVEYNDDVIAKILAEIRETPFVVADFTGHRNGVYFESGFALGLSLPVIMMWHMEKAQFDTNHFNHITWGA